MNNLLIQTWFKVTLLLVGLVALGAVIFINRELLVEMFIPSFRAVVNMVETRFKVGEFNLTQPKSELLVHLRLVSQVPVMVYGRALPGMDVSGTTLSTHVLQHIFIFCAVLSTASLFSRPRLVVMWLLGFIGLVLSLCLDIPFTLLGSIEGLLIQHLAPDQLNQHWLVRWEQFMTNGGRMAVALAISMSCVVLAQRAAEDTTVD